MLDPRAILMSNENTMWPQQMPPESVGGEFGKEESVICRVVMNEQQPFGREFLIKRS